MLEARFRIWNTMNVQEFNKKYKSKGGIEELTRLRSMLYTKSYIGSHFGVTPDRVRQWTVQFFGSAYDPRPDRKEAIIHNMIEFARHNTRVDFKFAFRSSEYYKETLVQCEKEEIWPKLEQFDGDPRTQQLSDEEVNG